MAIAAPRTLPAAAGRHAAAAAPALRALVFVAVAAAYALAGARLVDGLDVVAPDGVDRLARAYLAWHGDPAKLAVVGFGSPPLPTLALVPLAAVGRLATSLTALPVYGGLCGAVTVLALDRTLARCGLRAGRRAPLVAAFALNPVVAFQFTTGTPAALALAMLAVALRGLAGWGAGADPRGLLGAGAGFAGLLLCRYELAAWAVVAGALVVLALGARGAAREEAEGSAVAFGAPAAAALAVLTLLCAAIVNEPLRWVREAWEAGGRAGLSGGDALRHTAQLAALACPLAAVAALALLAAFARRRDVVALGLAVLIAGGLAVAGLHAYAADATGPLRLHTGALVLLTSLAGAGWAYREAGPRRALLWALTLAALLGGGVSAWRALEHHPYVAGERAWARALRTGDAQGTTAAAREIARAVRDAAPGRRRVLADEGATGAAILLSRDPKAFLTRAGAGDAAWRAVLGRPARRVDLVLSARGDAIDLAHPGLADGRAAGMVVVAAAGPYVLARVLP